MSARIITLIPSSDNEKTTTRFNVSWDVKLSDNIPLLFRGIVRERIAEATEEALIELQSSPIVVLQIPRTGTG